MATSRLCSIPDCGKPAKVRGWCQNHYSRWRKHGDPSAGRINRGDALRYFREVVLVYDGDQCLTWPFSKNGGYGQMRFDGKPQLVSRLVCEAVYGPPPSPRHAAAHNCGKGDLGCCSPNHLRWATYAENSADQVLHGTSIRGERQGHAKLTAEKVRQIREMAKRGTRYKHISETYAVAFQTVFDIVHRRTWKWLE